MMKRLLFWFHDGVETINLLTERYFPLAMLFRRLIDESYSGKKLSFVNVYFYSDKHYQAYPILPKNSSHYYGGHLQCYGPFDLQEFEKLNERQQDEWTWNNVSDHLQAAAIRMKNNDLLNAVRSAYTKGIEQNLNTDYRNLEANILLFGQSLRASIWMNFTKDLVHSNFTLEKHGLVIFEQPIDKSAIDPEFFQEMYKTIEVKNDAILIKVLRYAGYEPIKISVDRKIVLGE